MVRIPRCLLLLPLLSAACSDDTLALEYVQSPSEPLRIASREAGTVRGKVIWRGELPHVSPLEVRLNPLAPATFRRRKILPNPNAPQVDPETRGISNVLVYLRGHHSSDWPHPQVRVDLDDNGWTAFQGDNPTRIGLVRRGNAVTFRTVQQGFQSVRGRGAVFFTHTLVDPAAPVMRTLDQCGLVELTSGGGHYWLRAYLYVTESPLCVLTDRAGGFTIQDVPAGAWELVAWLPGWEIAEQQRDPELGVVSRLAFRPGHELTKQIHVLPDRVESIALEFPGLPDNVHPR